MYITRKIKAKHIDVDTEYLDHLACEAGRCYSKTVSLIRKVHKRKGFWISEGVMLKYQRLRGYGLHSHTVQGIFQSVEELFQGRENKSRCQTSEANPKALQGAMEINRHHVQEWCCASLQWKRP